jgi:hypothetical protein
VNALVIYEDDDTGVTIKRVFVGDGDARKLRKEFDQIVDENVGPYPKPPDGAVVGGVYFATTDHECAMNEWRGKLYHASRPREFARWLVEHKGWKEAEDIHSESE